MKEINTGTNNDKMVDWKGDAKYNYIQPQKKLSWCIQFNGHRRYCYNCWLQ